eukprot:TRINITY_DN73402_c0_g1_i1.p1 TRINITY_DN73402_c0_g1~~TRINITY_DN73402_c0_g1_i1.p1  ORF type:complete len:731 (-),score=167.63 TRINITY_DN73402_c0_g1_i1:62-2206(-)
MAIVPMPRAASRSPPQRMRDAHGQDASSASRPLTAGLRGQLEHLMLRSKEHEAAQKRRRRDWELQSSGDATAAVQEAAAPSSQRGGEALGRRSGPRYGEPRVEDGSFETFTPDPQEVLGHRETPPRPRQPSHSRRRGGGRGLSERSEAKEEEHEMGVVASRKAQHARTEPPGVADVWRQGSSSGLLPLRDIAEPRSIEEATDGMRVVLQKLMRHTEKAFAALAELERQISEARACEEQRPAALQEPTSPPVRSRVAPARERRSSPGDSARLAARVRGASPGRRLLPSAAFSPTHGGTMMVLAEGDGSLDWASPGFAFRRPPVGPAAAPGRKAAAADRSAWSPDAGSRRQQRAASEMPVQIPPLLRGGASPGQQDRPIVPSASLSKVPAQPPAGNIHSHHRSGRERHQAQPGVAAADSTCALDLRILPRKRRFEAAEAEEQSRREATQGSVGSGGGVDAGRRLAEAESALLAAVHPVAVSRHDVPAPQSRTAASGSRASGGVVAPREGVDEELQHGARDRAAAAGGLAATQKQVPEGGRTGASSSEQRRAAAGAHARRMSFTPLDAGLMQAKGGEQRAHLEASRSNKQQAEAAAALGAAEAAASASAMEAAAGRQDARGAGDGSKQAAVVGTSRLGKASGASGLPRTADKGAPSAPIPPPMAPPLEEYSKKQQDGVGSGDGSRAAQGEEARDRGRLQPLPHAAREEQLPADCQQQ